MDEETSGNIDTIHISCGSATTGVHLSMDVPFNDEKLNEKIDKLIELQIKATIARKQSDPYLKS